MGLCQDVGLVACGESRAPPGLAAADAPGSGRFGFGYPVDVVSVTVTRTRPKTGAFGQLSRFGGTATRSSVRPSCASHVSRDASTAALELCEERHTRTGRPLNGADARKRW
jgi:hypothetical protein